jgi:hypothetical protein
MTNSRKTLSFIVDERRSAINSTSARPPQGRKLPAGTACGPPSERLTAILRPCKKEHNQPGRRVWRDRVPTASRVSHANVQTARRSSPRARPPGRFFGTTVRPPHPVQRARPRNSNGFFALFEAHVSAMTARGRRPRWSERDRERVLALAAEGASQREIAKAVFGDARYRGRVERVLRAEAAASNGPQAARNSDDDEPRDDPVHPGSDLDLFRELVLRTERAMRATGRTRQARGPPRLRSSTASQPLPPRESVRR